jgi:DNA-binding transcriptional regulator YiaG
MSQPELPSTQVDAKEIRKMLGLSINEFALRYGFHPTNVRNWELGNSAPSGADRTLLIVLERIPDEVAEALNLC